jgi:type II secretory pathway component GspD/PulD (secretin)
MGSSSRWPWGIRGFRGRGKEAVVARAKAFTWFTSATALALVLTGAPGDSGTATLSSLLGMGRAWGQEVSRPMRAHNLLTAAIDAHRRGDYDQAAKLLEQAQAGQSELSDAERKDLASYQKRNAAALQARKDGTIQLREVEKKLATGRTQEATDLLKKVATNRDYLAADDKTKFNQLSDRLMPRATAGATSVTAKGESSATLARTKLQQARALLARANFDAADQLAREADALGVTYTANEDTPRKVREAVTQARSDPKFLFGAARAAFQRNELDRADQLAMAAEAASSSFTFPFWGDTPSKLRKEIQAARSKTPAKADTVKATTGTTNPQPAKSAETASTPQARSKNVEAAQRLLTDARKALDAGDVAKAEQLTNQARTANPDPKWWELETTDKLLADIRKAKAAKGEATAKQAEDPHALVKKGRELMEAGKLDEATQITLKAKAAGTSVHWGIFEDTPESLLTDIDRARVQHNKDESVKVLADGRRLFEKNDLDGARKAAYRALQLHGPYSILEMGDRPQKLLADIETAEAKKRLVKVPPVPPAKGDTAVAAATPTGKGATPPATPFARPGADKDQAASPIRTVSMTDAPKQRAQTLLAEARQLQTAGRLVEARQRLQEAQRAGATFGPGEETPDAALVQLNALAYRRVVNLVEQADDYTKTGAADPARCQKAEANLKEARQLALGFGYDTVPVDTRLVAIQKLRTGTVVASATTPVAAPTPTPVMTAGRQRLNEAREELRRGQTNHARQLCAEAWKEEALRPEAGQLLRTIDQEELNQHCLEAARAFDAGLVKYREKDYQTASKVFALVDVHLLDRDRQAKLGEVMSSPEMQRSVVQVRGPASPAAAGAATATDVSLAATKPASGDKDFLKNALAMQEIKFQQLREAGRVAQREAIERFQAGDRDRAVEILQEYSSSLEQASLAPDQLTLLRRPIEDRIQKLRTLKAQQDFDEERRRTVDTKQFNPGERQLAEQHKQKQVAELMAQYETFYRDGKYLEAERQAQLALDLDPDNAAAAAALKIVRIQRNVAMNKKDREQNADRVVKGLSANEGPVITDVDEPVYVDTERAKQNINNRKDIGRGISTLSTTVKQREIEGKLNSPVALKFNDTPLKNALNEIKTLHNIPIFLDERSLQDEGINPSQPLSFDQEGLSLKSELNLILSQLHLTYMVKDDALVVTTEKNSKGRNVRIVYQVADLVIPIQDSHLPQAGAASLPAPNQPLPVTTFGGPGGATQPYVGPYGLNNGQQVGVAGNTPSSSNGTTITKQGPSNTIEGELINLIKNSIKPESWDYLGGTGTIDYFPIGQALVVNQTADIQEQVADLLQALRRLQDVEVAVEVRFISLDENFFERIGVNFNVNIPTSSNNARVQPLITSGNFTPDGFVNAPNFKNVVVGLQPGGPGNQGVVTNDLNIPLSTGSYNFGQPPFLGNYVGAFPSGGLDIGLAFLSNIQVFLFMEAVQQDTRSNIMQAPKLVMYNGQSATLTVSDTQLFTTNVSILPINGQIVAIPSTTPFNNGTFMSIQPIVSADRRFVRLAITETISNLATATVPLFPVVVPMFPDFNGGGTGEPVLVTQFLQQPITSTITVTTTVLVPDGGTVLIGGLKRLSEGRNESGPPVLSKIPYLNRLFKNEGYARETESLLMLVTPRIIITEEEESRATGLVPAPIAPP